MYGLPEQAFRLTMLTSTSVIALMKATPGVMPAPITKDDVTDVVEKITGRPIK